MDVREFVLDTDGVGLLVDLVAVGGLAFEEALEDAEQAGVPVTEDEEQKEGDGEVVLGGDRVVDGGREVAADEEFDPGNDAEALAIFFGLGLFALLLDAIFGGGGRRRS